METICLKCHVLFSDKNIINLSSAVLAQKVVKVKMETYGNITLVDSDQKYSERGILKMHAWTRR